MKDEKLLKVLIETNEKRENPVNPDILRQILSIIMLNPLEEDRGRSQDQIKHIITKTRE